MTEDVQYKIPASTSPLADEGKPLRSRAASGRTSSLGAPRDMPTEIEMAQMAEGPGPSTLPDGSKRIPLGQKTLRLKAPERPGFMRRWVNDLPGRVSAAEQGGYSLVKDDMGKPIVRHAGSSAMGGALQTYLMEIPRQWYDEDFAFKQESVDETDKAIYGGTFKEESEDKRYVPRDTPIKFGLQRGSGRG